MTKESAKIFLDFLENIVYNKGTKTKGNKPQKGIDTMLEITYRDEEGFQSTGIFFSWEEFHQFKEDCLADGEPPISLIDFKKVNPYDWCHKALASGYEWPYIVEIMGNAVMGQEWASQYEKWADMEKALKELGII